jgi:diguanylate cyclase (GGDEF)-like protein
MIGDQVLMDFAQIMSTVLHREDIIGRLGGDEFVAILPRIGRRDALHVAEKVRQRAQRSQVCHEGCIVPYTVCIGITDDDASDASLENLLCAADRALYLAKERSRNCSEVYPPVETAYSHL